jgi:hypothetical protein
MILPPLFDGRAGPLLFHLQITNSVKLELGREKEREKVNCIRKGARVCMAVRKDMVNLYFRTI